VMYHNRINEKSYINEVGYQMANKAKILARLIDEKGISRRAFAEKIGIPPTTLQSMLSRGVGKASIDNVIKVCKGLGIDVEELERMANPDGSNISATNIIPFKAETLVWLPVYGRIAAGIPIEAIQEIEEYFPVDTRFININGYSIKDFFYLRVTGDSMEPGISHGDKILVRRQPVVENNEVAVVLCSNQDATVKRVVLAGDKIILNSDNKAYSPQIYDANECQIIGKVIQRIGPVK
jgi:repressor LexA